MNGQHLLQEPVYRVQVARLRLSDDKIVHWICKTKYSERVPIRIFGPQMPKPELT